MTPATDPSGTLPSAKYIQRKYAITPTTAGNIQALQLFYSTSPNEVQGSATETKLGSRYYNGASWAKLNYAGYTRTSGSNVMTISALNNSLAGVTELGMFQVNFVSVANGANISLAAGFDENALPDNTDDVLIDHTGVITGTSAVVAGTLTVNAGKDLTTNNAAGTVTVSTSTSVAGTLNVTTADASLGALSTTGAGSMSVAGGRTLTGTSFTNNTSGTSTFTGNVSLSSLANTAGTLNFNGGASAISGAVSNAAAGIVNVGGTLGIATGGAITISSAGNIVLTGAASILNVGASGVASNLTMAGTSTLEVTNAAGQLNVFGNLELASGVTLTNNGTITVGE
jgi:hypothetical protein